MHQGLTLISKDSPTNCADTQTINVYTSSYL